MCVEGEVKFTSKEDSITIKNGETILVPASLTNYSISSEDCELLEVSIP